MLFSQRSREHVRVDQAQLHIPGQMEPTVSLQSDGWPNSDRLVTKYI